MTNTDNEAQAYATASSSLAQQDATPWAKLETARAAALIDVADDLADARAYAAWIRANKTYDAPDLSTRGNPRSQYQF